MESLGLATAFLAREVVGVVFLTAGLAKLRDDSNFRRFLERIRLTRGRSGRLPARLLAAVEVGVGASLVIGLRPRLMALIAFTLLVAFTVPLALLVRRGDKVPCGCFGRLDDRPISRFTLLRNAFLAALAATAVLLDPSFLSLDPTPAAARTPALLPILGTEVAVICSVIVAVSGLWLRSRSLRPPPQPMAPIGAVWTGEEVVR
jgi:uncharacterized membrane protein YphA (DoxX/SURF4 family)